MTAVAYLVALLAAGLLLVRPLRRLAAEARAGRARRGPLDGVADGFYDAVADGLTDSPLDDV